MFCENIFTMAFLIKIKLFIGTISVDYKPLMLKLKHEKLDIWVILYFLLLRNYCPKFSAKNNRKGFSDFCFSDFQILVFSSTAGVLPEDGKQLTLPVCPDLWGVRQKTHLILPGSDLSTPNDPTPTFLTSVSFAPAVVQCFLVLCEANACAIFPLAVWKQSSRKFHVTKCFLNRGNVSIGGKIRNPHRKAK